MKGPDKTTAAVMWVVICSPKMVYEHYILSGCQTSKLDFVVSTWDIKSCNYLFAYKNCTR